MTDAPNFTTRLTAPLQAVRDEIATLEPGSVPDAALKVLERLEEGLLEYAALEAAPVAEAA